ncbi:MAG TPA: glycosyltransferase family 4 protein [Verrucomicrobiales bacterium]|nr:glycosyltransferase family 4 protein [Verrucomicrobiales bacterium]
MSKVLHVNTFGQKRGGAENYIRESAAALSAFDHALLFLRDPNPAYLGAFSASHQTLSFSAPDSADFLRRFSPDLIILHNHPGQTIAPFLQGRSASRKPVAKVFHDYAMIYTGTGYNRLTLRRSRDPAGWRSLCGALTRDAFTRRFVFDNPWRKKRLLSEIDAVDAVETHTHDMRRTLQRNGIRRPRFFLNPVWGPVLERETPVPKPAREERTFVFLGNLIRGKGLHLLLRVLRRVPRPWRLRVLGDGYQRASLESYARRHRLPVEFLGHVPKSETGAQLERAQFLAAPSVFEPFGYVLVEAMAHGLPVLAFDAGGPSEIIVEGETGFLVRPFDLDAFAVCIERLLADPGLCRSMGEKGRARMREHYTLDAHMERTRLMFRELGL